MMRTGYGPTDGRCFSCSEASVRTVSLSPCASRCNYKALSHIKVVSLKFNFRGMSLVCKAGSNGYAGNLEFSRQNKHRFSQSKNKQNDTNIGDKQLYDKVLETLTASSQPKFQPNRTPPEPRKKEETDIVYGKLKAKLPSRADVKGAKKAVGFQGRSDEDEEDSCAAIELLRKHVSQIGDACNSNGSSIDDLSDQSKQDGLFDKEKNTSSPKLATEHITPMGNKSSRNGSSRDFFLDKAELLSGSFSQEKSTSSPKLVRKRVAQTGRKSISNGSSSDFFLDQSEQDGVIDEEKSTSSFDSSNHREQESSFVELLKKHKSELRKNGSSKGRSRDFFLDHSEQNGAVNKEKNTTLFDSNDFVKCESPALSRPVSNFRRRSPIPRVKFELIRSNSVTDSNLGGKRESTPLEHENSEGSSDFVVGYSNNEAEQIPTVEDDLSAMKLPELKALAKSRGMKGLSRLRKHQLLELLSGGST